MNKCINYEEELDICGICELQIEDCRCMEDLFEEDEDEYE